MSYPNYGPSAYGEPPQTHPNGTAILVLGILGLVVCSPLGFFAWVMGNRALREIDDSGYVFENRSSVQAGRICGIVAGVLCLLTLAFVVLLAVVLGLSAGRY
jgi:hypothetical protein